MVTRFYVLGETTKKPRKLTAKKLQQEIAEIAEIDENVPKAVEIPTPTSSTPVKKKKPSEIDKLLGDEGAANMLNSLSNNTDASNSGKPSRAKAIKSEVNNVQNVLSGTAKTKATKVKEIKESPQKQQQTINKTKNTTPKSSPAGKKRGPKQLTESWDYIYKSRPDDCMIIRRRSNSSYSSTASLSNRNSIDLPNDPQFDFDLADNNDQNDIEPQTKRSRNHKEKAFEFAKPATSKSKKIGKLDRQTKIQSNFDKAKQSSIKDEDVENVFTNHKEFNNSSSAIDFSAVPIKLENGNEKDSIFTSISICRYNNFNQIILKPQSSDPTVFLSLHVWKNCTFCFYSI